MNLPNDLITQTEAAEKIFRVKPQSLRAAFHRGRYPTLRRWKLGRQVWMSEAECRALVAEACRV